MELFIDEAYATARKYITIINGALISITCCVLLLMSWRLYSRYCEQLETLAAVQQEVAQLSQIPERMKQAQEATQELELHKQKIDKRFLRKHNTLMPLLSLLSERLRDDVIITELVYETKQFKLKGTARQMNSINELIHLLQKSDLFSSVDVVSLERLVQLPSTSFIFSFLLSEL